MTLRSFLMALAAAALVLQWVPYGHDHTNPPTVHEPAWDSPRTRDLFMRACGDCHSNATVWPAYSSVAPVSWFVTRHVAEGREHLNVSAWMPSQARHAAKAASEVREGEMPLSSYLLAHPEARLGDADKQALIAGLAKTFGDKADQE